MATATLQPQPVPEPAYHSPPPPPPGISSDILDEVRAAHQTLRARLAGAISSPPPGTDPSTLPTVPLIDLNSSFTNDPSSRAAVAAQIRSACLTTGFFQISNHGVTAASQAKILEQARRYFHDLTPSQKDAMHIRHNPYFFGYEPGNASYTGDDLDAESTLAAQPETKEGFNWGYEPSLDPSGGDGAYVELDGTRPPAGHGHNVWPAESDLPGFREGVAEYYAQVLALSRHLFRLFALSLGLEESYFDPVITHPGGIARLLYYLPQPADDPRTESSSDSDKAAAAGKLGLGAHTDYECFTLLLSSASPGLEILFPPSPQTGGKPLWRPCPVRPGTLTVNVADFLQRWTHGRYKSTIHRVVTRPGAGERYSVPFFYSVNYDADVGPLLGGFEEGEGVETGKEYRAMRAGEYVLERLRATRVIEEEEKEKGGA